MNLKTFVSTYDLHDSGIEDMYYFPDSEKLVIDLVLCNWRQTFYKEGEPELIFGKLIFTGVSTYHIQAKGSKFDQDEILNIQFIPPKKVKITLLAIYFPSKEEEIKLIEIEAEDVTWNIIRVVE